MHLTCITIQHLRIHSSQWGPTARIGKHTHVLYFERWCHCVLTFCPPCSWTIDDQLLLRVPEPPINEQPGWNFYDFGFPWEGNHNPWAGASGLAPFDQEVRESIFINGLVDLLRLWLEIFNWFTKIPSHAFSSRRACVCACHSSISS